MEGIRIYSQAVKQKGVFQGFVSVESEHPKADKMIEIALRSKARDHSVQLQGNVICSGFVRS